MIFPCPDDILAKEKRDIVLHATLALLTSNTLTADERINEFKDILLAGKDKLATRRDHPLVTFAKALGVLGATVFGIFPGYFAYQHFFGKKATEGHKLLNEATAEKKQEADPGEEINRPFD